MKAACQAVVWLAVSVSLPQALLQPYTFTWNPGQSGFQWSNPGNWSGGPAGHWPNDNYDCAVFSVAAADPILTRDVIGNQGNGLGQLDFQTSGWSINNESGGDYTIYFDSASYYQHNAIFSRGNGLNAINTKVAFSESGQNVYTGSGNTLVFGGGITGSYAPVITSFDPTESDTGAVRLDAASTVSGSFLVREGTLLVRHSSGLGTGSSLTIGDSLSSSGANARLLIDAEGVTISQNIIVQAIGGHRVNATIGGNHTQGNSVFSGTITLHDNASFTSANTDGNAVFFNNTITGVGGVSKTGPGTVVLNHANNYQGDTIINSGTLRLGALGALPTFTSVTLANVASAVLDLNGHDQAISSLSGGGSSGGAVYLGTATLTLNGGDFAGVISGSGGITKVSSETLTLSGQNLYSGLTTISEGRLSLGANNALGSGNVLVSGPSAVLDLGNYNTSVGTVTLANGGQIEGTGTLTSSASFEVEKGTVSASLGGQAGLNKTTSDTVTLNGANTFSGPTRIRAGTLRLGHSLALQNSTVDLDEADSGVLDLGSLDVTLGGLKGVRDLQIPDGKTLSVGYNQSSTVFGGKLTGNNVVFQKVGTGTLTLTGDNTYSGVTRVAGGILQVGNGGTSGWINTPIENNGELWFNRSDFREFGGNISGTGSVRKLGQGTLVLSGTSTYSGNTVVQEGTLLVNGSYSGNGAFQVGTVASTTATLGGNGSIAADVTVMQLAQLSPGGSIGTLTVDGDVSLDGSLQIELDAEGNGSADMLLVSGRFNIGATASLVFSYSNPPDDPAYIFVRYGTLGGKGFMRVENLPPGYYVNYNYLGQNAIAIVVPEPAIAPMILLVGAAAYCFIALRKRMANRALNVRTTGQSAFPV